MKACLLLLAACSASAAWAGGPTQTDVEQAMQRDFRARGQATMDRVVQDRLQRICTETHDQPPAELASQIEAEQMKTIVVPEGSLIGDWKRGQQLAESGQGLTWNDKPGSAGGSCYNCHELAPQEASFGSLGPSLRGFGKKRGNGPEMQRYVYAKIYNAKAYSVCSQMPRLGYSGTLNEQQIKDLTALLLDPASPVNQ